MRNVNISILNNGLFDYRENGNDARHLKRVKMNEVVHWNFINREGYKLRFNEGTPRKSGSPFATDPLSTPGHEIRQTVVLGFPGQTFPYTVTVLSTNETNDPDIQIDDVRHHGLIAISIAVGLGLGFLLWKRFFAKD